MNRAIYIGCMEKLAATRGKAWSQDEIKFLWEDVKNYPDTVFTGAVEELKTDRFLKLSTILSKVSESNDLLVVTAEKFCDKCGNTGLAYVGIPERVKFVSELDGKSYEETNWKDRSAVICDCGCKCARDLSLNPERPLLSSVPQKYGIMRREKPGKIYAEVMSERESRMAVDALVLQTAENCPF